MKLKKLLTFTLLSGGLVFAASQIAYAGSVRYSFRLPAATTNYAGTTIKTTPARDALNSVSYFGKPGKEVVSWIEEQKNGADMSDPAYFTNTGAYKMHYILPGKEFVGKTVKMAIKTSIGTWTKVDVEGDYNSDCSY